MTLSEMIMWRTSLRVPPGHVVARRQLVGGGRPGAACPCSWPVTGFGDGGRCRPWLVAATARLPPKDLGAHEVPRAVQVGPYLLQYRWHF